MQRLCLFRRGARPIHGRASHDKKTAPAAGEDAKHQGRTRTEGLEIFDGHKLGCSGVSRGKKVFG